MGSFGTESIANLTAAVESFTDEHLRELKSFIFQLPEEVRKQTLHRSGSFRDEFLKRMMPDLFRTWLKNRIQDRRTAETVFGKVLTQFFNYQYRDEQAAFFKKAGFPADGHELDPKGGWKNVDWKKSGSAAIRTAKAYPKFPLESFILILAVFFRRIARMPEGAKEMLKATGLAEKMTAWQSETVPAQSEIDVADESELGDFQFAVERETAVETPASAELPEPVAYRLSGDWETVLDRAVKKTITAAAYGESGALKQEEVADMVDELIHLSSARVESLYHAGYLEAMTGIRLDIVGIPRSEEAAEFHVFGLMCGYAHSSKGENMVIAYDSKRREVMDLLAIPHFGVVFGGQLETALQMADRWRDSALVLEKRAAYLTAHDLAARLVPHHERLTNIVRDMRAVEGLELAAALRPVLDAAKEKISRNPESAGGLRLAAIGIARRAAQCKMARKEFAEAREDLARLAAELETDPQAGSDYAAALSDLVLANASIGDIAAVHRIVRKGIQEEAKALESQKDALRKARDASPDESPKARYILGALAFAGRRYEESVLELTAAVAAMRRRWLHTHAYPSLASAYFLLALSYGGLGYEENISHVLANLENAADCGVAFDWEEAAPVFENLYLMDRGREAAELFLRMVRQRPVPDRPSPAVLEMLALLAGESEAVRDLLLARLKTLPPAERFKALIGLLCDDRIHSEEFIETAFSKADELAAETPGLALEWARFLAEKSEIPGFTGLDLRAHAFDVAWSAGEYEIAAQAASSGLLANVIAQVEKSRDPDDLAEMDEILERLKLLPVSENLAVGLAKRLEAVRAKLAEVEPPSDESLADAVRARGGVSIVVIGGNEVQRQYDTKCQTWISSLMGKDAGIVRVSFKHTGWSQNYGRQFDDMKGDLERADVIVIIKYIRTMLGRRLRKECDLLAIPWVPCTGKGGDSIIRSLKRSLAVAAGVG